jgi:hypothetical protein
MADDKRPKRLSIPPLDKPPEEITIGRGFNRLAYVHLRLPARHTSDFRLSYIGRPAAARRGIPLRFPVGSPNRHKRDACATK